MNEEDQRQSEDFKSTEPNEPSASCEGTSESTERSSKIHPLNEEHEQLGALWKTLCDGTSYVASYGQEPGAWEAAHEFCALADLTDLSTLLIGGAQTPAFVATVCSQEAPPPGELRYALVLAGDGSVVAPVLLGTVAPDDVVVWVPKGLAEGLKSWLLAMAALKSGEEALWPELSIDDPVEGLVPLALMGKEASIVLEDYLSADETLPSPGTMKHLLLDAIPTTCLCLPAPNTLLRSLWVIFVPGARAVAIWRSLLSFPSVTAVGTPVFWGRLVEQNEALARYLKTPNLRYRPADLGLSDLLRAEGGFVGARSLGIGTAGKETS